MKVRWLWLFCSLLVVIGFGMAVGLSWPDSNVHMVICDVGQGDAILISYGFQQTLIDGGPDDRVMECLGKYMPWWDRTIELVVITHAHTDHIGGLPTVLRRYSATELLFAPYYNDTEPFRELMSEIKTEYEAGAHLNLPILGQQYRFPQVKQSFFKNSVSNSHVLTLTSLFPRVEERVETVENWLKTETELWDTTKTDQVKSTQIDDHNGRSIVLLLEFGKISALFTGDLEQEGELSLVANDVIDQVTILKAGHHGSNTSSTVPFLQRVTPEISLISSGQNNKYGHPSPEVLARLSSFDIEIWRTDQQGTIEVVSDGDQFWVDSEKN